MSTEPDDPVARLAAALARVPYVTFLGMRADLAGDEMTAILPFSEHIIGNPPCQPSMAVCWGPSWRSPP